VGLSGSELNLAERTCLKQVFGAEVVTFPTLAALRGKAITQAKDFISIYDSEYFTDLIKMKVMDRILLSPVIIVAGPSYAPIEMALQTWGV